MLLRALAALIVSLALITISSALGKEAVRPCIARPCRAQPTDPLERADCLVRLGKYREALDLCNQSSGTTKDLDLYHLHLVRSNAYSYLGENDKAVAEATRAIELEPGEVDAYVCRSDSYNHLGEPGKALADCNKGLELDTQDGALYCNRGEAQILLRKYFAAIKDLNLATELIPSHGEAYYFRGLAYEKLRNKTAAAADKAKSIQLGHHPGSSALIYNNMITRQ